MGLILYSAIVLFVFLLVIVFVRPKSLSERYGTVASNTRRVGRGEFEDITSKDFGDDAVIGLNEAFWKRFKMWILVAVGVLFVIPVIWNSFVQMDQRQVGIVTSFGKYENSLITGGLHPKAPWEVVEKFEGTLQPVTLTDISTTFSDGKLENSTIAGGKGWIDSDVDWQIGRDKVQTENLWDQYRTFEKVSNMVSGISRDSIIEVANQYSASNATVSQKDIAARVKASMEEKTAKFGIEIIRVSITSIDLDPPTQEAVNRLYSTQQDIKRAENEKKRAQVDAEKAQIQKQSGSTDKDQLMKYCLDIANDWDTAKSGSLPATFNCGLGGADTGLIVDGSARQQ